ncbi:MAG: hypothetical protein H0V72_22930 [Bradyrhizobium sp.]|nr:hypothetical protein [Bradyrhizobium sp.]
MPSQHHIVLPRDALAAGDFDETIYALITEIASHRPLTATERKLRCITRAKPWSDTGCTPSTWYRRRARAAAAEHPQ